MTTLNQLSQVWTQIIAWWNEISPAPVPIPEVQEPEGRDALLLKLEEHRKSQVQDSAARQAEIEILAKELREAEMRVDTIRQEFTRLCRRDWLAGMSESAEIDHLRALIAARAPGMLEVLIREIDHELDKLRSMDATTIPTGTDRISLTKKTVRYRTNSGSIARRARALQTARERAVAMRTENMPVAEITTEIDRLKRALPKITDEAAHGSLAAMILSNN
ncbi:MAG: hypothetical protein ABIU05_11065 [Nitrospirales bacterium]